MRPPERKSPRPPRSVIYRRRLAAVAVLAGGFAAAWFAVASIGGSNHAETHPTVLPPPKPFRVVFPEGFTREQMAARVAAVAKIAQRERGKTPKLTHAGYLAATSRPRRVPGFGSKRLPLEGFLFPATYDFTARTTGAQLATQQLQAFHNQFAKLNLRYARSKNLTPYDVLTIASMIEEEAAAPEERQLISAVIYNRLHLRMPLGIDATLRYGLHIPPTESIHQSQLESPSLYNTSGLSGHTGLPPTPIGNPGLASLQAAAHPAHVDYLYYVRKPDKIHHFFTNSLAAFNAYKAAHGYR